MESWSEIRNIYVDVPLRNGDVALITDQKVIHEMEGMADAWDPERRADLCRLLQELEIQEVLVAVARPGAELLPQDHALWADLREELLGSGIAVHPLEVLPGLDLREAAA